MFNLLHSKKNLQITHNIDVLSLFFGSLLGESYGELRSNKSFRISFQQENANVEYLFWFYNFLYERNYCSSNKPKLYKRIGKKNKISFYYRLNSFSFYNLKWLYNAFYKKINKKNIKRIPDDIYLDLYLTPLALAVWIMDDGSKCSAGLKIATNSFQYKDLERIINFLNKKYQLQSNINKTGKKDQYILYFPKKSMKQLSTIIKPYLVQSMYYKLNNY